MSFHLQTTKDTCPNIFPTYTNLDNVLVYSLDSGRRLPEFKSQQPYLVALVT